MVARLCPLRCPCTVPITCVSSTGQAICSAGGVHAKHNAGDSYDPARRKSMSAHPSNPDLAGQQPLPDWLFRQREAASRGHSRLAQPPTRLVASPASTASRHDGAEGSPSRPGGGTGAGVASSHESRFPPPGPIVTSLTPFSAFAQHSQQTHSRSSSGSAESDPERPRSSGGMGRKRSGSFGGRGAALGFMMEAQQQWRQDSFTKAAERRRNEQSSEPGRSSHNSLLSHSEQHAGQQPHLEAGVTSGADNQPSLAKAEVAEFEVGRIQQQLSTAGTTFDPPSAAGPALRLDNPASAGTAGQAAQASENTGSSQHPPVQSACNAQTLLAIQNPFLAAAQQWRESSSNDSTDQSQHSSDDSSAVPPQQPSRPNHFADSAVIAEQWLATRQELLEQSDQWDRPGGDQGSVHRSLAQEVSQSHRGQRRSHTAQQDSAQQDSERRETHAGMPLSSSQGPRRSMSAKAGPPPRKISFQKKPPAIHPPGMWCAVPPPDRMCCTTFEQLMCLSRFPLAPCKHLPWSMYHQAFAAAMVHRISRVAAVLAIVIRANRHGRTPELYVCMYI